MAYIGRDPGRIGSISEDNFTGTGVQSTFALALNPGVARAIEVSIQGVIQIPNSSYTVLGKSLIFSEAPALNSKIYVRYLGILGGSIFLGNPTQTFTVADGVALSDAASMGQLSLKANIASPALTGVPTVPTAAAGTNTTQIASTAFVNASTTDLVLKANIASPALTGVPTVPTAAAGTNTTQIASTAFVGTAVSNLVASAPAALNTLNELAVAMGNDANFATTITNSIATKAPLASPALTGVPTVPTAAAGTNTTQIASTAFVQSEIANDAPTKTGGGASGSWAISVTGSSASCTGNSASTSAVAWTNVSGRPGISGTWNWSGLAGQPSWLWGSNDGATMNVYNPSNFSVNYANTVGSITSTQVINALGYTPGAGGVPLDNGLGIGSFIFAALNNATASGSIVAGQAYSGLALIWGFLNSSSANNLIRNDFCTVGTWRAVGSATYNGSPNYPMTTFQRIA